SGILHPPELDRVLATVLFTHIVGPGGRAAGTGADQWRDLLGRHHAVVRRELERFRGREIEATENKCLAIFDGPARAIRAACAVRDSARWLGVEVKAGLHTGEFELIGDRITGVALEIGAQVAAQAGTGEILVSSTVKDLVSGSGIGFSDRGVHVLEGSLGEWKLFAVE
ncbi:MAG: adenylate/guanylate cyclase domain-containing protein, partial [Acidobacteria bacterium]|nr:adenylate/guanylate cyclase domain-containing protein [Acidobacteriota bacterium]